uniref:Uncharacterized protein n=1 Tax=Sipha flava TaxID=143950 RepID=A0A2S2QN65_9HEMI
MRMRREVDRDAGNGFFFLNRKSFRAARTRTIVGTSFGGMRVHTHARARYMLWVRIRDSRCGGGGKRGWPAEEGTGTKTAWEVYVHTPAAGHRRLKIVCARPNGMQQRACMCVCMCVCVCVCLLPRRP